MSAAERAAATVLLLALSIVHFVAIAGSRGRHGFADLPIFLATAEHYLDSGELYPQAGETVAFGPAAAVYKFPPLFAALLLPSARDGIDSGDYRVHWWVQLLLYGTACILLLRFQSAVAGRGLLVLGVVVVLNFTPFFETLDRLQLETPILLLIAVAMACECRGKGAAAGAAIGIAAALKVYPVFLLVAFVARRRWAALPGFVMGLVLATAFSGVVFGWPIHKQWAVEVLPTLLGEDPITWTENLSPARFLRTLGGFGGAAARMTTTGLGALLLAATVERLWRRGGGMPRSDNAFAIAWAIPVMLLLMPNSWANYQLLLLAPILALPLLLPEAVRGWPGWLLAGSVVLMLAYAPCEGPESFRYAWPCAQTPYMLGLFRLPRGLHDLWVDLRVFAPLTVWLAGWVALRRVSREASSAA